MIASLDWEGLFCGFLIPTLFMVALQLWAIFDSSIHPVTTTSEYLSPSIYKLALLADKIKPEWPYAAEISLSEFQDYKTTEASSRSISGRNVWMYLQDGLSVTDEMGNPGYWFVYGNSANCYVNTADKSASYPGMLTSANIYGAVMLTIFS